MRSTPLHPDRRPTGASIDRSLRALALPCSLSGMRHSVSHFSLGVGSPQRKSAPTRYASAPLTRLIGPSRVPRREKSPRYKGWNREAKLP